MLVEQVKDYAIVLLDVDGNIVSWNKGLERITGYSAEEILGRHMSTFYTAEDARAQLPQRLLHIAKTEGRVENECWRIRKDGTRFWASVVITALYENNVLWGFGKVTRDLTERKTAEDALSELAGRLVSFQDEERRRIGRELHDTTSPLLTSLSSKLYLARQRARTASTELVASIDEALLLTEATSTAARTLASHLHPQMLEQSGLLVALKWFVDAFANKSGVRVMAVLPAEMNRLPREHEVVLFRATQEWLHAALQAGTTIVRLHLTTAVDDVTLLIEAQDGDWSSDSYDIKSGNGDVGAVFAGMRERVRQFGGLLETVPAGPSVTLRVRVPTATRET